MTTIRRDLATVNTEVPGTCDGDWEPCAGTCPGCKEAGHVRYRIRESSCGGYEDDQYKCGKCGESWWIEGSDA